jgi:type III pantothenate kinase
MTADRATSPAPLLVADVGNTRVKWGRCGVDSVQAAASLPPDDPAAWQEQLAAWGVPAPAAWVVSGVHPQRRDRLAAWLGQRGDTVRLVTAAQLPLRVALEQPDRVGIDRLLDAVAVNARRPPGTPAVIVDAGSAVTVDYLDADGVFRGGAILPGLRLMAQSLHDYTALLPLVAVDGAGELPGTSTTAALQAGIFCAAAGGIREAIRRMVPAGMSAFVVVGGGDGPLLAPHLGLPVEAWPLLTLEGLRLTAEGLP